MRPKPRTSTHSQDQHPRARRRHLARLVFLCCCALFFALGALTAPREARAVIVADHADDVCPPSANPCTVNDVVSIVSGSTLDFGVRTLSIGAGGQLDVGGGSATVRCGRFEAAVGSATAVRLKSASGAVGGVLMIEARRACTGNATISCFVDAECAATGAGVCQTGNDGAVVLDGKVDGQAQNPGSISIVAAGAISVSQTIDMDATIADFSGGDLTIQSMQGAVTVSGRIESTGGSLAAGGFVRVVAAGDITLSGPVDVGGGDADGGTVELAAGGSVALTNEIRADSRSGEGFGGEISVRAGANILVDGGGPSLPMLLSANGHGLAGGGDGGEVDLDAGGTVTVGSFVKVIANGAIPDGIGGDLSIVGARVFLLGAVEAKGTGGQGIGGLVDVISTVGDVTIGADADIVLTGSEGGGDATVLSSGDAVLDGTIDVGAGPSGPGGAVSIEAFGSAVVTGTVRTAGAPTLLEPSVAIQGCAVRVAAGGLIDNGIGSGENRLSASSLLSVEAGASVFATSTGANTFVYRDPAVPPQVSGTVSPNPTLVLDTNLPPCDPCGGPGACDDANPCTDDVCDPESGCVHTPNSVPCDDGNPCTTLDQCSGGVCGGQGSLDCNDGNPCTDDTCDAGAGCVHTANTAPCDDGLSCTTVDICSGGVCVGQTPPACDDGNPCTLDTCDDVAGCLNLEEPQPVCRAAGRHQLRIKRPAEPRRQLKWKWQRGDAVALADLGDPSSTTAYSLCVYDAVDGVRSLAAVLSIAANGSWHASGEKGWKYRDALALESGVRTMKLRTGDTGRSSAVLVAKGSNLSLGPAATATQYFASDPSVVVQLVNDLGLCLESEFTDAKRNEPGRYDAKKK